MSWTRLIAIVAVLAAGCADDFAPYNQVSGLRLLAMRATPPDVAPGAQATLDALVSADASYQWSWCPVPFSGQSYDQCPVTEQQLAQLADMLGADPPPPYDLGSEAAVTFPHSLPPQLLATICESAGNVQLPEGVATPECDGRFKIAIRLLVSDGEASIVGIRELGLIYRDDVAPNQNPHILGGEISVRGAPPFALFQAAPTTVVRDVEYSITLNIEESQAESYIDVVDGQNVDALENLIVTWFSQSGEMDKTRSSFIEGATDFENLRSNRYRTPTAEEYSGEQSRLYLVIRDDRGGLDWLTSDLELVE